MSIFGEGGDEFVVIACDGLWDVLSSEEVVGRIKEELALSSEESKEEDEQMVDQNSDTASSVTASLVSAESVSAEASASAAASASAVVNDAENTANQESVSPAAESVGDEMEVDEEDEEVIAASAMVDDDDAGGDIQPKLRRHR